MTNSFSRHEDTLDHLKTCAVIAAARMQQLMTTIMSRRIKRRKKFRSRTFLKRERITMANRKRTWHVNQFRTTLRMTEQQFSSLVNILRPFLPTSDKCKSPNGSIPTDIRIALAISYLTGGNPLHLCNMFHVGLSTVMVVTYQVVSAINKAFSIKFPENHTVQKEIAAGFQKRSSVGFDCVAGCVDGLIIWIEQPLKKDCDLLKCGQRRFYCERKSKFGLNCQAICDHNGKFLEVWIGNPASSSDFISFIRSSMYDKLSKPGFLSKGNLYNILYHFAYK
jgi:hypothetical protein